MALHVRHDAPKPTGTICDYGTDLSLRSSRSAGMGLRCRAGAVWRVAQYAVAGSWSGV